MWVVTVITGRRVVEGLDLPDRETVVVLARETEAQGLVWAVEEALRLIDWSKAGGLRSGPLSRRARNASALGWRARSMR